MVQADFFLKRGHSITGIARKFVRYDAKPGPAITGPGLLVKERLLMVLYR